MTFLFHFVAIALSFVVVSMSSAAELDPFDKKVCSNEKYLRCLGTQEDLCVEAHIESKAICAKRFPIDSNASDEDSLKLARKYGDCSIAEVATRLANDYDEFEECSIHLKPILDAYHKERLERRRDREEKMKALEDLLYMHRNSTPKNE